MRILIIFPTYHEVLFKWMDFWARGAAELGPARASGAISYRSNYNPPNPISKVIQVAAGSTKRLGYEPGWHSIADKAPYPAFSARPRVTRETVSVQPIRSDLRLLFPHQAGLAYEEKARLAQVDPYTDRFLTSASSEDLNRELEHRRRVFWGPRPGEKIPYDDLIEHYAFWDNQKRLGNKGMPPRYGYSRSRYGITYRQQKQLEREYYARKRRYGFGRYRRTVKRAGQISRSGGRQPGNIVVSPQHGIPPRLMTKCSRWVFVPTNVNGAGTGVTTFTAAAFHESLQVGGNRLSDTFLDHGVGSLYGVDDYGDLYSAYRVHASKCTIHVVNLSTTASGTAALSAAGAGIWFFLRYQRATPVADTTPASTDEAMNFPRMKKLYCPPPGAGQASPGRPMKMSYYVKTTKVFNFRDIHEHGFEGQAGTPPEDQFDWVVYAGNHANASDATVAYRIMVKLTYWVEFYNRRDLSNADFV